MVKTQNMSTCLYNISNNSVSVWPVQVLFRGHILYLYHIINILIHSKLKIHMNDSDSCTITIVSREIIEWLIEWRFVYNSQTLKVTLKRNAFN